MISIDVVSDNNLWNKKIKKKVFFNTLVKFFPKKYRFIGKKINLSILLSDNKNIDTNPYYIFFCGNFSIRIPY